MTEKQAKIQKILEEKGYITHGLLYYIEKHSKGVYNIMMAVNEAASILWANVQNATEAIESERIEMN